VYGDLTKSSLVRIATRHPIDVDCNSCHLVLLFIGDFLQLSELLHQKLTLAQQQHSSGGGSGVIDGSYVSITRDEFIQLVLPHGGTELTDLLRRVFYTQHATVTAAAASHHDTFILHDNNNTANNSNKDGSQTGVANGSYDLSSPTASSQQPLTSIIRRYDNDKQRSSTRRRTKGKTYASLTLCH
jgi:hypothetical protein